MTSQKIINVQQNISLQQEIFSIVTNLVYTPRTLNADTTSSTPCLKKN